MTLSDIGSWASIISLPLSIYAIATALNIRSAIRRGAMDRRVTEIFERLKQIPPGKKNLTSSHRTNLSLLLTHVDNFYLSKLFWCDREAKILVTTIKTKLAGNADAQEIREIVITLETQIIKTARI